MTSREARRTDEAPDVPGGETHLFYDGTCGLCHRTVRVVLWADRRARVRFAPLDGPTFRRLVGEAQALPDSFVLRLPDGELLTRSSAVVALLRRLGGAWRAVAAAGALVPTGLANFLYDGVAGVRSRLFRPPTEACPTVRPELQSRFDP